MYVCTYVCMYVCMYVCASFRIHICMHARTCVHAYVYTCVCTYARTHVRSYVCKTWISMRIYVCTYVYAYKYSCVLWCMIHTFCKRLYVLACMYANVPKPRPMCCCMPRIWGASYAQCRCHLYLNTQFFLRHTHFYIHIFCGACDIHTLKYAHFFVAHLHTHIFLWRIYIRTPDILFCGAFIYAHHIYHIYAHLCAAACINDEVNHVHSCRLCYILF